MQMPRFKVPEALVTEILSKLPVKSLIRFNCVCKYWCSSFQTPCFISKHYHNNLKKNNLNPLLQRTDGNADIPYFSQLSEEKGENFLVKQNIRFPFFIHDSPCVWGARRGLFCLHSALMDDTKVAIWNPSTREFKILPPSSVQRPTYPGLTFGVLVYPVEGIDKSFDLWVMNGEEWTKQFSIESIPGVVDPLGFWKNNELFLLNTNYEVVLFDPSTQELKVLGINSYLDHHREYVSLFFYVESLVSISGIQEHKDHIIRQLVGDASKNLNRNIDQVDTKYDDG
ncbi:putative F-box protein At1g47790 isoform X3 [Gossypium hirsutum]|uniref:F-box protein At1g47790 isoform X3 n=1 Tax=Gossypium hirsutum TaxID=3635 RepID=A0ABM3AXZ6_GOSHI|nr:putative F-box protein At1g47790 isoform X3 [Gossypium hirsutum]